MDESKMEPSETERLRQAYGTFRSELDRLTADFVSEMDVIVAEAEKRKTDEVRKKIRTI
ncbi:MAG: hypothetical protein WCL23_03085 [Candidatus Moraniibacteriota bacterium]